jgi:hypothetical protein
MNSHRVDDILNIKNIGQIPDVDGKSSAWVGKCVLGDGRQKTTDDGP